MNVYFIFLHSDANVYALNLYKHTKFENTIIYSDVMKLDLGLNVYEEIVDKVKLKKHLEEK